MKLKRALSLILVLAMVIPLMLPSGGLTVVANAASASEIESYISTQQGFTFSQYETLKAYYDTCVANNWTTSNVPSLERLKAAVEALAAGADYYDDLKVLGTYQGKTEKVPGVNETEGVGVEPENPGDPFPTETNTTNYEILWGGLEAQRYTADTAPTTIGGEYEKTWPSAYSFSTSSKNLYAFHVNKYYVEGQDGTNLIYNSGNLVTAANAAHKLNWLTLKDEVTGGADLVTFSMGVRYCAFHRVVYNYIDANNYNFVCLQLWNTELHVYEVKDGVCTKTYSRRVWNNPLFHAEMEKNGVPIYADFDFVWNGEGGYYEFTITDQNGTALKVDLSQELTKTTLPLSKVNKLRVATDPTSTKDHYLSVLQATTYITVASNAVRYAESRITNEVPEVADVERLQLETLTTMKANLIAILGEEAYKQLSNVQKLEDALTQAQKLQSEYEATFSIDDVWNFEDDGQYVWPDLFTKTGENGLVQTVDNPSVDAMNSSAKVLQITNGTVRLADGLKGNSYVVSGLMHGTANVYIQYQDGNNYQAVHLAAGKKGAYTNRVDDEGGHRVESVQSWGGWSYSNKKDGTSIYQADYGGDNLGMPDELKLASSWAYFEVRLSDGVLVINFCQLAEDGNYYYRNSTRTVTSVISGECYVAFGAGTVVDDLCIAMQNTDGYYEAESFLSNHKNILNQYPFSDHISGAESELYEALVADYANLSKAGLMALGPVNIQKVKEIKAAYAAVDADIKAYEETIKGYAEEDYRAPGGTAFSRKFTAFSNTSNDDSLSLWEADYRNFGVASIMENSELGHNVLRLRNSSIYALKDTFTPNKSNLSEISYHIEPTRNLNPSYNESTYQETAPAIHVYVYYKDANNFLRYEFYQNNALKVCLTNGSTTTRSTIYYDEDFKINPEEGFDVNIRYASGRAYVTLTGDGEDEVWEAIESVSMTAKNRVAFSCGGTGSWRFYGVCTFAVDISDISVKFARGDWDDNVTQTKLNVSYNGNTYQSPGDVAVIRGENLGKLINSAKIIQITDIETNTPGYIDRTSYDYAGVEDGEFTIAPTTLNIDWSQAQDLNLFHRTTDSIQFIIPEEFSHGIYAVQLSARINGQLHTRVVYLNSPVIDFWLGSDLDSVSPGGELEIVGENMAPNQNTNTEAMAYDLRIKDRDIDDVKVVMVKADGSGESYELEIKEITSDYNIVAIVPSEIEVAADGTASDWELYVYNGYGDGTCWSVPQIVKVARAKAELRSTNFIDIRTYGASCYWQQDATAIIQKALTDLHNMGGGTLYLPEGSYRLCYTVYVPDNVTIQGDGHGKTSIVPVYNQYGYGSLIEYTGFVVGDNVTIDGVGFLMKRARRIISTATGSDNVIINDVKFYTNYLTWANNSAGEGGPLVDRFEIYKYSETSTESPAMIYGTFTNLTVTNIVATVNVNSLSFINSYDPTDEYARFENIDYATDNIGWTRALFSKGIWKNVNMQGCSATQARGVYMYECKFGPSTTYNREIWVADLSGDTSKRYYVLPDETGSTENSLYLGLDGVTNSTTASITGYSWLVTGNQQIYVVSGNGAGQTIELVGMDTERNCFIMAEPMQVALNRNSTTVTRAPREDIYFVDCDFYEGGCPGGFFGGCADVVHDGDYMEYTSDQYYEGIFGDVNWYCSMINNTWSENCYKLTASYAVTKGAAYNFIGDSNAIDNVHVGMLIRNNRTEGLAIAVDYRNSLSPKDMIIDNNLFNGITSMISSSKSGKPDGLTIYRNRGDKLVSYFTGSIDDSGYNGLGYKYVTILGTNGDATDFLLGDVNMDGQITLKDVTLIHYAVAEEITLTEDQVLLGDVDGNGVITAVDATYIRNYLLTTIDKFPASPDPTEPGETTAPTATPTVPTTEPTTAAPTVEASEIDPTNNDPFTPGYH